MKCSPLVATARRRLSSLVSLILATLLVSGCMRTNIEMLSPVEYAPVDPDSVQVFLTADEAPSRRVQLAVVTSVQQGGTPGADEANRERVIRALREKAGEVGADAIVLQDISPRPDEPDFLRGWAVAIRTRGAADEIAQDSTAAKLVAVTPPWAPPPVREPTPVRAPPPVRPWPVGVRVAVGGVVGAGAGALVFGFFALDWSGTNGGRAAKCFETSCALIGAAVGGGAGAVIASGFWAEARGANPIVARGVTWLVVGAGLGAVIGEGGERGDAAAIRRGEKPISDCAETNCVLESAAILGGVGAAVGVVWGIVASRNRPATENTDRIRVNIAPQRDGRLGLGLSVGF